MEHGRKVKSLRVSVLLLIGIGFLMGAMGGCSPDTALAKETDERSYRRGKSLLREGRKDEALQAFLSLIGARPDAAESHLEAGLIYLNHLKDPLAAIYHFRSYLALSPQGQYADFVKELILTAQKDFAQTLPGEPFGDSVDRVDLMETVKQLKEENTRQKQMILQLQRELAEQEGQLLSYQERLNIQRTQPRSPTQVAPIIIQQPPVSNPATQQAGARTYTVESGDTLSRISAKMYGTSARWTEIFQANTDQLPSPNALKPGQVLRIP